MGKGKQNCRGEASRNIGIRTLIGVIFSMLRPQYMDMVEVIAEMEEEMPPKDCR